MRVIVLDILRKPRPTNTVLEIGNLYVEFAAIAKQQGLKVDNGRLDAWQMEYGRTTIHAFLITPIWDVLWDLFREGVIMPGAVAVRHQPGDVERSFPYFHITEFGKKVLQDETTPYDPTGYLDSIVRRIANIDPLIMRYVAESAECLRRGCLMASAVTLGCASEKAFLLLSEKFASAMKDPVKKAKYEKAVRRMNIKPHHREFVKELHSTIIPAMKNASCSNDMILNIEVAVSHIFEVLRVTRNSAGHPIGFDQTTDQIRSQHLSFPLYLQRVYELINWLDQNPIP